MFECGLMKNIVPEHILNYTAREEDYQQGKIEPVTEAQNNVEALAKILTRKGN